MLQPHGRQTLLVSETEVQLKGGPLGQVLPPLVSLQIRRIATRTLAAFASLVEHGEAPAVKHSRLPVPAPACEGAVARQAPRIADRARPAAALLNGQLAGQARTNRLGVAERARA